MPRESKYAGQEDTIRFTYKSKSDLGTRLAPVLNFSYPCYHCKKPQAVARQYDWCKECEEKYNINMRSTNNMPITHQMEYKQMDGKNKSSNYYNIQ